MNAEKEVFFADLVIEMYRSLWRLCSSAKTSFGKKEKVPIMELSVKRFFNVCGPSGLCGKVQVSHSTVSRCTLKLM